MKQIRRKKIILICVLPILALGTLAYINYQLGNSIFDTEGVMKDSIVELTDVNKKDIFLTMADIKEYPKILPDNYITVDIINDTNGTIYSKEEVQQMGIKTKMLVKHEIIPYSKHTLTILDGDARGSIITEFFDENDSHTKLTTDIDVHLHGILSPFTSLTKSNLDSAVNTVISKFVDYTKKHAE